MDTTHTASQPEAELERPMTAQCWDLMPPRSRASDLAFQHSTLTATVGLLRMRWHMGLGGLWPYGSSRSWRQQRPPPAEASVQAVSAGAHIHLWLWCAASYCIDSAQESRLSVGFLPSVAADAWLTPAMLSIQLLNGPLDVSDPEYPYPSSYMLSPEKEASILKSWPLTTK